MGNLFGRNERIEQQYEIGNPYDIRHFYKGEIAPLQRLSSSALDGGAMIVRNTPGGGYSFINATPSQMAAIKYRGEEPKLVATNVYDVKRLVDVYENMGAPIMGAPLKRRR